MAVALADTRSIRRGDTTALIAGAWCVVRKGKIVRAARVRRGERQQLWVAGVGNSGGGPLDPARKYWPVHYGGFIT